MGPKSVIKIRSLEAVMPSIGFSIGILGWLVFVHFLYYEYHEYGKDFIERLFSLTPHQVVIYSVMFLTPLISTVMGYLVNERVKLLKKTLITELRLEHANSQWRATFDTMPHGVMLIDGEFNILRANGYISELSGIPIKGIIGRKCYEVVHSSKEPIRECPLRKAGGSVKQEVTEYYDSNRGRYFMSTVVPFIGDEPYFVHTLIDITEMKQKEKKLTEGRDAFFNMLKDIDLSYKELKSLFDGLIFAFADALDAKSPWTRGHSERVTAYAILVAEEMGLSQKEMETLKTAALLHDIGKIGTYDVILDKTDKLTDEEFNLIKMHPAKGAGFLKHIRQMKDVIPAIRYHHERVDGSGYPDRLMAEEIPLLARILCVADCFDSMISDRPYRPAKGGEYAISELKRCSGSQFDTEVVNAFLRVLDKKHKETAGLPH